MNKLTALMTPEQILNEIRECYAYNKTDGNFYWAVKRRGAAASGIAGSIDTHGYRQIRVGKRPLLAHRAVWLLHHGVIPDAPIDHINGDRLDNRIENLRLSNNTLNGQNQRKAQRKNKSGFLGVSTYENRFRASIKHQGKLVDLGWFDDPETAHEAYLCAKRKLHPASTI